MIANDGPVPGKRVLIVDDNVDTARMMMILLGYEGHDVRTANEGHEALSVARSFLPEIVLLDLTMPGMSGMEVAAALREDEAVADTLIVAVSGYDEDGVPPGFDHLMVKPVDHERLFKLLSGNVSRPKHSGSSPRVRR